MADDSASISMPRGSITDSDSGTGVATVHHPRCSRRAVTTLSIVATITVLIVAVTVAATCGMGDCKAKPSLPTSTPTSTVSSVSGRVLDASSGAPIAFVRVSSAVANTTTSANGTFVVPIPVGDGASVATFTVNGCAGGVDTSLCSASYAPNVASVPLLAGVGAYGKTVYLFELTTAMLTAGDALETNLSSNVALTFPASADLGDLPPGTILTVSFAVVPPHAGPGALRSDTPGELSNSTLLQSLFMVYVSVADAATGVPSE